MAYDPKTDMFSVDPLEQVGTNQSKFKTPEIPETPGGYDPTTGAWKNEDLGVASRVNGLLDENSKYIQQGEAAALRAGQRRGLLNSSMTAQAGEAARIDRALPIAQQESSQAQQRYSQGRDQQQGQVLQTEQIRSQKDLQTNDILSREKLASMDISSREKLAAADIAATKERQQVQIGADTNTQIRDQAQQQWLAQFDSASRERLQMLDNDVRLNMQRLDIEAQKAIAGMNVAASERADASRLAVQLESLYQGSMTSIMNDPNIPAEARQRYFDFINQTRTSNVAMLEQLYAIDLDWATGDQP